MIDNVIKDLLELIWNKVIRKIYEFESINYNKVRITNKIARYNRKEKFLESTHKNIKHQIFICGDVQNHHPVTFLINFL